MRIVHVIIGLGDGGAERSLYKLVTNDDSNVHSVISLTSHGKYGPLLSDQGISVVALGWNTRRVWASLIFLRRTLRAMEPEILHGWMPHGALVATALKTLVGAKRLLWSIRASDYGSGMRTISTRVLVKILARFSKRWPNKILVVGRRAAEMHLEIGFSADKIICIPNGYESPSVQVLGPDATNPSTSGVIDRTTVLGMVARYHPQKDHFGLLRALSMLRTRRGDWSIRLAGEGLSNDNSELVTEISRLGLSAHIELWGVLENPEEFYRTLDLHILASSFGEGFPNVVAESMLVGIPNIVTDVGDSAEIVADTGWIAQPADPQDLARALETALNCELSELRARGLRAKERILQAYSLEDMVESHRREYNRRHVVAFPRYSRLGASSRVRMFQFEETLTKAGWDVSFYPFSDDRFLLSRYKGRKAWLSVVASYFRRVIFARKMMTADLVWVEKELLPWAPSWIEKALVLYRGKVVYDFDDAVHEQFRENPHATVRLILGKKIPSTVVSPASVIAGNKTLEKYFSNELRVESVLLPSTIDTERLSPAKKVPMNESRPFVFGWIGTPVTYQTYVEPLLPMFEAVAETLRAEFWVIGVTDSSKASRSIKFFPWTPQGEGHMLQGLDVGIMPLTDDPWSRGKCGYKLLQYMAVGKAVIASPVGVNKEIVSHQETGFLVQEESDWMRYLSVLASDRNLSAAMGAAGYERVANSYSLKSAGVQLVEYFDTIASS